MPVVLPEGDDVQLRCLIGKESFLTEGERVVLDVARLNKGVKDYIQDHLLLNELKECLSAFGVWRFLLGLLQKTWKGLELLCQVILPGMLYER